MDSNDVVVDTEVAELANIGDDWRVFWRLIFTGRKQVTMECNLWADLEQPAVQRIRIAHGLGLLDPVVGPGEELVTEMEMDSGTGMPVEVERLKFSETQFVQFGDEGAIFNNYHLTYNTFNLQQDFLVHVNNQLTGLGLQFDLDSNPAGSKSFAGENIRLRVDLQLANPTAGDKNPIFHFPLAPGEGKIGLWEEALIDNKRKLLWQVKNAGGLYENDHFWRQNISCRHSVEVRQDADQADPTNAYFEFMVDRVMLYRGTYIDTPHMFQLPNTFHIGHVPGAVPAQNLNGTIFYLEFDPNDSCVSCLATMSPQPNPIIELAQAPPERYAEKSKGPHKWAGGKG